MRTNISKFKNLKRSDFKNLLDFTDVQFKKAYKILIEDKINESTNLSDVNKLLNNLKTLEFFYLLDLCLETTYYRSIKFLLTLFFGDDFINYKSNLPQKLQLRLNDLKNEILLQSKQKKPLFKKEIAFTLFLQANLTNMSSYYKKSLFLQVYGIDVRNEFKFLYEISNILRKTINAKVPHFSVNIEKFNCKNELEIELDIFTKFWEESFQDLYLQKSEENMNLIIAQYIFRDYLFNKRDTLEIDTIASNNYINTFKLLDKVNREWKHDLCLYLYELCNLGYINTKSKDELIYFLSIIFNSFNGFSFSSIETKIARHRDDATNKQFKKWEKFVKTHFKR